MALRSYRQLGGDLTNCTQSEKLISNNTSNSPMKSVKQILLGGMLAAAAMTVAPSAWTQQINGTPGSPDATVTIDGKQIPPPPMPFGGVIKESAQASTPYWPPRVVPRKV